MITVTEYESLGKGKLRVRFDNEAELILYRGEAKQWKLREEAEISEEDYQKLLTEVVGKRAKKRAMHLLECMDRTEKQLRDKLEDGKYPQVCIDEAIAYVRKYHYIDDSVSYTHLDVYKRQKWDEEGKMRFGGLKRKIPNMAGNKSRKVTVYDGTARVLWEN